MSLVRLWLIPVLPLLAIGTARGDDPPATEPGTQMIRGRIVEVTPSTQQLTVKPRKGESVKLTVDERSQLNLKQEGVKLDQLKEGTRVRATYETKNGVNRLVLLQDPLLTVEKAQKAFNSAFNAVKSYSYQQRDEYRRKMDGVMRALDEKIADLEEHAQDAGAQARVAYEKELVDLRQKRAALKDRARQLDGATADTWADVQAGVNSTVDNVQRAIERTRARIEAPRP